MSSFDWSWPTRIDREAVESALQLEFLPGARNVVFIAAQGLGKTMIAQNIAHHAILAGHSVLFTSTAQMLLDLGAQESSRALDNRLKHYAKISLLVLDEVGYIAFYNRNADLLFELVSRRCEQKSLVLTTNLAFDWPSIFPSATCTTALIDRFIHHADIIPIEGESYRKREAELQFSARRGTDKDAPKPKKASTHLLQPGHLTPPAGLFKFPRSAASGNRDATGACGPLFCSWQADGARRLASPKTPASAWCPGGRACPCCGTHRPRSDPDVRYPPAATDVAV